MSEIKGERGIKIFVSPKPLRLTSPSKLTYYKGSVSSGSDTDRLEAHDATVFMSSNLADAATFSEVYARLSEVASPFVLKALGVAKGDMPHVNYLALMSFDTTFAAYTHKNSPGVDENGRFTEQFIDLVRDIIDGIEHLHSLDYCCPNLEADDIAIVKLSGLTKARLWKFCKCDPGKEKRQKDAVWEKLGIMIVNAAWGKEASDLVKRIKNGELKGRSILEHGALLTVRKKFQNIMSLHFHISVYAPKDPNEGDTEHENEVNNEGNKEGNTVANKEGNTVANKEGNNVLRVADISVATLLDDVDKKLQWETPSWTHSRGKRIYKQTLRAFVKQLRIFVQHEVLYIPNEITSKDRLEGMKMKDLEQDLQEFTCGDLFRALQILVAKLNLKY